LATGQQPNSRDPVVFTEHLFNLKLWDVQRQLMRAVVNGRRIAVSGCHSSGKTLAAAALALWWACRWRDARVLILAPGWLTVRAVIWSEIHSLLARGRMRLPTQVVNQTEIRFGPSNLILGLSAADSARLQGHHSPRLLLICDEAVGLPAEFWPSIEGILSSGESRLLLLSNPTVTGGYFYDAFTRNRSSWTTFSISAFDTPNLAGLTLAKLLALPDAALDENPAPYLATRRWVRERYGEWYNGDISNSPLWASRVLSQFPTSTSNALIPRHLLEAARRPPVDPLTDVVVGVDVAGPGRDRTVCCACAGGAILEVGIYSDSDARGVVLAFLRKWSRRVRVVRIDSAGIGHYFTEHIRDSGFRVEPINVGTAALEAERFANEKAARYWYLRERFQQGEVSGLSADALDELAVIDYLIAPNGKTQIVDKETVKAALGKSPDIAESLMLALGEQLYTGPLLQLAPSTSWMAQRDLGAFRDGCAEMDAREDNEFGTTGIAFVRRARSKWDAM
jgi:hypothetical protein